jgi:selenocysteine lyase/cysteine desulfurase
MRLSEKLARLIKASPDEIAITSTASAGMNSVASALDFSGARNRVLVSNYEFPTSGQIWHAQERRGAIVQHVAENDERLIPAENFIELIDERTAIVAISRVCYRHGGSIPDADVRAIAEAAHRNGAYVILDCFQSLGAETLDVKALGVDFAVGGMYKYLLGTAGVGFLYARADIEKDLVPTTSGWFAQKDVGAMDIFSNRPSPSARRFQGGTPPVIACYAADAGLDLIFEYGPETIQARVLELTSAALTRFQTEGYSVATPATNRGPMIALRSSDSAMLVGALMERGVVTSERDGNVRAGFHFYNDEADLDRLIEALNAHRHLLR